MSVEGYQLASLESRVTAIEDARREEAKERFERQMKRIDREMLVIQIVIWLIAVAAWSSFITAEIVGD
jgi:hypothetical protein